jgi:hypothetical protein
MSVTSGGTAPKPFRSGGRSAASAGSAGMVMTFRAFHAPRFPFTIVSRYQRKIDAERSAIRFGCAEVFGRHAPTP